MFCIWFHLFNVSFISFFFYVLFFMFQPLFNQCLKCECHYQQWRGDSRSVSKRAMSVWILNGYLNCIARNTTCLAPITVILLLCVMVHKLVQLKINNTNFQYPYHSPPKLIHWSYYVCDIHLSFFINNMRVMMSSEIYRVCIINWCCCSSLWPATG